MGLAAVEMKSVTQLRVKTCLQSGRTTVLFKHYLHRVAAPHRTLMSQTMAVVWEVTPRHYNNGIFSFLFQLKEFSAEPVVPFLDINAQ